MQLPAVVPAPVRALASLLSMAVLSIVLTACGGEDSASDSPGTPGGAIATATVPLEATPAANPPVTETQPARQPASPTPHGTAVAQAGYDGYEIFGEFTFADPIDFPENLMLLVATGCTQCDSPPEALYRVWRNQGETHVDLLFDGSIVKDANGVPVEGARITSIAARPTLHDIVVTTCNECGSRPVTGSSTTVYHSIDGGLTWREVERTEQGNVIYAMAITDEGIVMEHFGGGLFYLHGDPIEPPEGANGLMRDVDRAGELRWLTGDGSTVLDANGTSIARVEPGSTVDSTARDHRTDGIAAIGWGIGRVVGPFEGWTVTVTGPTGNLTGFRHDTILAPVAVLGDGSLLGRLSDEAKPFGGIIGFIDASRGRLTPIHGALLEAPFGDGAGTEGERNDPLGAVSRPFLRVSSGVNCLPIRSSTGNRSPELTCAADGTLVYDLHNTTTVGAQEWRRVRLLDGREGYAVSRYLTSE